MPTFFHFTHTSHPFRIRSAKIQSPNRTLWGIAQNTVGRKLKLYPYQQHIIYLLCPPHMLSELLRE